MANRFEIANSQLGPQLKQLPKINQISVDLSDDYLAAIID